MQSTWCEQVKIEHMLTRNILILIVLCLLPVSLLAEPKIDVQIDRTAVYEGESFRYQLVLSDTSPLNTNITPDTSAWTDFHVQLLGKRTEQWGGGRSTIIINGQTIKDERSAVTYSIRFDYALIPKRAGSLLIPLPKVTLNGKVLPPQSIAVDEGERQITADHSIAVQVLGPEEQDIVFMSLETNRNRLYPLQPLEITLIVQIKGLPDRYAGVDPLSLPRQPWQPPQLQIPWADEDPKGFQADQELKNWLTGFLLTRSQRGGFGINNYTGSRDLFGMSSVPLQFFSEPRRIRRTDARGNETTYWEYRFSRTLFPLEFGNYSFGPVSLKGMLPAADAQVPDNIGWQRIYALAKPVSVAVVDVPHENRPVDYIGAFGIFRWEVNLTPHQARVGDPMTLTLRLSGTGSTVNVRPMDLSVNPDVAANFRVHMPPTEEVSGQSCTFIYTIRPLNSGHIEFPPISVSVFDVNTEKFAALHSLPIPLEIAESETLQSATLFGNVSSGAGEVQLVQGGLFANKTTLTQTLPPITFVQWITVVALLGGCYVVIALGVLLLRFRWSNPQRQRQRGALSRAKYRLAEVSSALRKRDSVNFVEISSELRGVFLGYIADRMDGTEQGMTTSDACRQLLDNRVSEPLVNAIRTVLESLDAIKYGGRDISSLDELANTAASLLRQLDS